MIEIITYDEKTVQALHDALLYDGIIGNDVILSGMEMAELGGQNFTLDIQAGYGVIQGRVFKFGGGSVEIAPPTSGSTNGQIIIQIDLSNDAEPIKIFSDNTMRSLRKDENFNIMKGVWETQYCTYTVSESGSVVPYPITKMKLIESAYRTQNTLKTIQETVTNHGTRINNQANRLTTLESMFPYVAVDTQTVTVPKNKTSVNISTSATKDNIDGQVGQWKFSHWGATASDGWIGATYIANVKANSSSLWLVGGARTVDSKVRIYAIYVKSPKW